jgi:hypothetical protein
LVKHLRDEWTPPDSVVSETLLDRALRDHVRAWIKQRCPRIPCGELGRWVAGHEQEKSDKHRWSRSKEHQVVTLWGAGKTSDLFIYHENGLHGLPKRGVSFEIKYVPKKPTGVAKSYATAITTTAGQLLAYSIRHEWTIGFVWIDGPRRRPKIHTEAQLERSKEFLKRLPSNATMIVRFREHLSGPVRSPGDGQES